MLNFTMRTCVPINANRLFVCKITSFVKQELSLHSVFVSPYGVIETKVFIIKLLAFLAICQFILQNKAS